MRERNPERSRERILAAALEEFAAKGFAGARVEAIARRAGLSKQLISHHFGGKEALYEAVCRARWEVPRGELADQPAELPGALATLFERAWADPLWVRVLLWEAVEGAAHPVDEDPRSARYAQRLDWVRQEQAEGRLPADLDSDLVYLSVLGAAVYPLLLPRVAEMVAGQDVAGDAFRQRYRDHLLALAAHLAD